MGERKVSDDLLVTELLPMLHQSFVLPIVACDRTPGEAIELIRSTLDSLARNYGLATGTCPDAGTCHHACAPGTRCWRVDHAGPLSGVYPGDDWPADMAPRRPG